MAPEARSRSKGKSRRAPTASFPDPTQPSTTSRKKRPLDAAHECGPLGSPNAGGLDPVPPKYTIDLSRPPAERYTEVVADFRPLLAKLPVLFDQIVAESRLPLKWTRRLARILLRRVYSKEQTEELRGISKASGVDMYLLVCFNTLLDSFMGCTSGGARVQTADGTRMYHFRTLDWAMDILRHVVVELEFVNKPHGHIIARSVTYVGFVGVLTGVRRGLSISLNFRPCHNDPGSLSAALKLCYHQLAVLLGRRPSIVSHLRDMLVPRRLHDSNRRHESNLPTLESIRRTFPSVKTSAAYLIFSDGDETTVLEKDRITAVERSSNAFVAATNCDACREGLGARQGTFGLNLMGEVLDEADGRLEVLEQQWRKVEERFRRRKSTEPHEEIYGTVKDVEEMVEMYPITNECTHYSLIMDPKAGDILWVKRYALGAI